MTARLGSFPLFVSRGCESIRWELSSGVRRWIISQTRGRQPWAARQCRAEAAPSQFHRRGGAENPHTDRHSGPRRPICLSLSAFGRGHSQPCVLEKGGVRRSCPASGSRKVGIRGRQARLRGEAPYDTCLRRVFEFPVFSTYGGFLGTSTRAELHDGLSVYGDRLQKKNWMQTQRAQNSFLPKWVTSMHLSPKYSWSEICVLCIGARGP